jgi:5-methylcytosine-specific restriction endonuclease McrA
MSFDFNMVDEREIKREKEKARRLRRTNWWYARVQKGECYYCRRLVGRLNLTMDHVVPLIRGGKSRKGNLVAACKECNNKKKYLLPLEWEAYLKDLANRPE